MATLGLISKFNIRT